MVSFSSWFQQLFQQFVQQFVQQFGSAVWFQQLVLQFGCSSLVATVDFIVLIAVGFVFWFQPERECGFLFWPKGSVFQNSPRDCSLILARWIGSLNNLGDSV